MGADQVSPHVLDSYWVYIGMILGIYWDYIGSIRVPGSPESESGPEKYNQAGPIKAN